MLHQRTVTKPSRLSWTAGVVRMTLSDPADALDRVLVRARHLAGGDAPVSYETEPCWEAWLHRQLGLAWPCPVSAEFEAVWAAAADLVREQGLELGRGAYGGWDDADPGLARAAWCLTAHLQPEKVVETGVARGLTSRIILERLERNGSGHLWSIDLPAPDAKLHGQIGVAVSQGLRDRWSYLSGSSRQLLPSLLAELGEIELFVHDSSHTRRNVSFELEAVWPALGHGVLLADDVHRSDAFGSFISAHSDARTAVARADDGKALFGIAINRPRRLVPYSSHD
ncbi:MAG TPA: class I SAM-dependent methyltransferase [Gaiellaceae bacterium]|nr:class I SAM-dependent methyltransferase [Gaiellaceae bacterium]